MRNVARQFGVTLRTVQRWVRRASGQRLDRVDFSDARRGPGCPTNKTSQELEDLILTVRRELKESSSLGEFGAEAIHRELRRRRRKRIPSVRTIGQILERRGALDGRRRQRRPAPPAGWYLPRLGDRKAELDSFDIVEGLVIRGGLGVEVLNGISLFGGLVASWPRARITAKAVVNALVSHWRQFGLPDFAQFDNDTVFQGPHVHPNTLGRVTRMCLSLKVVPVFVPPRETGFQASIENYNGRWQGKVWSRFQFESRQQLRSQSDRFVRASRRRSAARIENAPSRRPFPDDWTLDLQQLTPGRVIFLRRTDDKGHARLLGHTFPVDPNWPYRLVRAELDLASDTIRFFALRRREPTYQPSLAEIEHHVPRRYFHE